MKKLLLLFLCLLLLSSCSVAYAHPGKTDDKGGHYNHSTGDYHYHHGYSEHEHYDMDGDGEPDCPYDFDDKTDHSSSSGNNYSSNNSDNSTPTKSVPSPENKREDSNKKNNSKSNFDFGLIITIVYFCLIFSVPIIFLIVLPFYFYVIEPIINYFKRRKQQKIDLNKNVAVVVREEPEEEPCQFYTGSRKIKKILTRISMENLSTAEKAVIDDYFLNIRCMEKRIKKLSEIEKYRTLLNDPHLEQDDYESHLKIISIYEGIILKEEEKIVPIIMKQPIS